MIEPSKRSIETLKGNGVSDAVIEVAVRMTECLRLAGDDVAESTDDDLFDDDTGRGQLLYRRGRNRIIDEFKDDKEIEVSTEANALHVLVDECALSFYSARHGLEHPALATASSRTKRNVVDEMQIQISGIETPQPRRLMLMHERDEEGLVRVAFGVLMSGQDWAWSATMYDRIARGEDLPATTAEPSYENQPEAELPPIERRPEIAPEKGIDQHLGS